MARKKLISVGGVLGLVLPALGILGKLRSVLCGDPGAWSDVMWDARTWLWLVKGFCAAGSQVEGREPEPAKSLFGRFVPLNDVWKFRPATATQCREQLQTAAAASSLNMFPSEPGLYLDFTDPRLQELIDQDFEWSGTSACCPFSFFCSRCKGEVQRMEAVLWDVAVLETAIWVSDERSRRKWAAGRSLCSDTRGGWLQMLLDLLPAVLRPSVNSPTKIELGRYQLLNDAWQGRPRDDAEGKKQLQTAVANVPVSLCPPAPGMYVNFMHPKIVELSTRLGDVDLHEFDEGIKESLVSVE